MFGMNKILSIAAIISINGLLHATSVTVTAPASLDTLSGSDAYAWGFSIGAGQTIASATISWSDVVYTVAGSTTQGQIFTDLLKLGTTGVTTEYPGELTSDYWASTSTPYTSVGTMTFSSPGNPSSLSPSYVLTGAEITALNSYLAAENGVINIGISPNCHYTDNGLTFTYTLASGNNTVPDGATTALLLGLGLAGLEIFRRQQIAAKSKV